MARFDDFFNDAYVKASNTAQEMAFKRWEAEQERKAKDLANQLAIAKIQQDIENTKWERDFKTSQEARREKDAGARTSFYDKRNQLFDQILGGINGSGNLGAGLPAGTTFNAMGLNIPLNRKFTQGEATTLSSSSAILKDLNELKSLYESGKVGAGSEIASAASGMTGLGAIIGQPVYGSLGIGKSGKTRQNVADLTNLIGERLLRLRSGAQINESEYSRFRKMLPSLWRDNKLDVKMLDRFINEFSSLQSRIEGGQQKSGGNSVNLDELFKDLPSEEEE